MRKYALCSLALFGFIVFSNVQNSKAAGPEKIDPAHSLSGEFSQDRFLSGFDQPLQTKGTFAYAPEMGLAWIVREPFASRLIVTKGAVFQEVHGQVVELEGGSALATQISDMIVPLLSSDFNKLSQDFEIKEENVNEDASKWHLMMIPKSAGMQQVVQKIEVEGAQQTQKIIIFKPGGDRDEIYFSDQAVFETVPEDLKRYFKLPTAQ